MTKARWIAFVTVGFAIAPGCAVFAAGFVATVYADMKFRDPRNCATGFAFELLYMFLAALSDRHRGQGLDRG